MIASLQSGAPAVLGDHGRARRSGRAAPASGVVLGDAERRASGCRSRPLTKVADGVHVGALFPRNVFNTVVLEGPEGDVVVDAGPPWSGKRLTRYLRGRTVAEHVVSHAHGDHVGSTAVVGDGPINLSTDPSNPRWLRMPTKLHHDPGEAVASRWRLTELRPKLIVSTHGYPVDDIDAWIDGIRRIAHRLTRARAKAAEGRDEPGPITPKIRQSPDSR